MNLEARATARTPVPNGQGASWTATAPAGLSITHIYTVGDSGGNVGDGHGWWGEFFWNTGPGPAGRSAQITDTLLHLRLLQGVVQQSDGRVVHRLRVGVMHSIRGVSTLAGST